MMPVSSRNVYDDLQDIKITMKESVDAVLARGEKLDRLQDRSRHLVNESQTFNKLAKARSSSYVKQAMVAACCTLVTGTVVTLFCVYFWS
jgi:hypothetical protein